MGSDDLGSPRDPALKKEYEEYLKKRLEEIRKQKPQENGWQEGCAAEIIRWSGHNQRSLGVAGWPPGSIRQLGVSIQQEVA